MTREEQIEEAEVRICTHVRQTDEQDYHGHFNTECSYDPIEGMGFRSGAKWADNHPINVWHDASEIPQEECPIVCINECNKLYVGNIHLVNEPNDYWYGKPTVWNDNHLQIHWRFVQKWAYVNDLLPKK